MEYTPYSNNITKKAKKESKCYVSSYRDKTRIETGKFIRQ